MSALGYFSGGLWKSASTWDIDVFEMVITTSSEITMRVLCDTETVFGRIAQDVPGTPDCNNPTYVLVEYANTAVDGQWTTITTAPLAPGTYYFGIAPNASASIDECAGGSPSYVVSFAADDSCLPPLAVCKDATVTLDDNGDGSIVVADVLDNVVSSCYTPNTLPTLDNEKFNCANVEAQNTVVLTVTDDLGQTGTCTANVIVVDDIAPNAICQDLTVTLDLDGMATIAATDIDNGTTDNCDFTLDLDITQLTCGDIDNPVTVTLTATDASGHTDMCTAMVTVLTGYEILDCVIPATGIQVSEDNGFCSRYVNWDDVVHNFPPSSNPTHLYTFTGATTGTSITSDGQFNVGTTNVEYCYE